jgi:KRAB domain-containing zinc finger protein
MGNLMTHKTTHTGDKPYECDVCNKRFTRLGSLRTHKRVRTACKPYECDVCKSRFSQSSTLVTHKTQMHKKNKSFECAVCKKKFTREQSLKRHRRVHLKDGLLLQCSMCGIEIHQPQGYANEMPSSSHYNCDKCDKQFPDCLGLTQHKMKDHGTSYQCDVCQELEAQEATGIGYICCICDTEFDIATELESHMETHDNIPTSE